MRKKTKNKAEQIRRKCVELAKKTARMINQFTCEYCGKSEPQVKTHGSHIYSEGIYRAMSSDLDNILCLCYTHHLGGYMQVKEPSWHKNPLEMIEWFKQKYPKRYKILKVRAKLNQQVDQQFWENKYKELQNEFSNLNRIRERNNGKEKSAGVPF